MGAWGPCVSALHGCLLDPGASMMFACTMGTPTISSAAVGPGSRVALALGPLASWEPRSPTFHLHSGQPALGRRLGPLLKEHHPSLSCKIQLGGGGQQLEALHAPSVP